MDKQRLAGQLTAYLESLYPERSGTSVTGLDEINVGWETELYTLEVHSTQNGEQVNEKRVLRVFQGEGAGRKSAKEYYLMRKLEAVGYPVPGVYGHEASGEIIGKPFILMEWVTGKTLDETYRNETPEKLWRGVDRLMALLAQLHRLDAAPFKGISELPCHGDLVQDSLDWYLRAAQGRLQWLRPVVGWLTRRKPCIDPVHPSLVHMDYHGGNVMLRMDARRAIHPGDHEEGVGDDLVEGLFEQTVVAGEQPGLRFGIVSQGPLDDEFDVGGSGLLLLIAHTAPAAAPDFAVAAGGGDQRCPELLMVETGDIDQQAV